VPKVQGATFLVEMNLAWSKHREKARHWRKMSLGTRGKIGEEGGRM
jgi:hypothetical protein